jgi:hypothetical protein
MSWHRISDDQLFTHSRISAAGSTGLFCIEDDERGSAKNGIQWPIFGKP